MFILRTKVKGQSGSVTEGIPLSQTHEQVEFPFIKHKQNCLITAGYKPPIHTMTYYSKTLTILIKIMH